MSHACVPNVKIITRDDFSYICEATVPIKSPNEIVTSYHHYYYHLFGTMYRWASSFLIRAVPARDVHLLKEIFFLFFIQFFSNPNWPTVRLHIWDVTSLACSASVYRLPLSLKKLVTIESGFDRPLCYMLCPLNIWTERNAVLPRLQPIYSSSVFFFHQNNPRNYWWSWSTTYYFYLQESIEIN